MRVDERKAHDAVSLYYVAGLPYREIAKHMKTNHRAVQDWTEQGRMYVKAALRFGAPNTD
jgi:DNA-directed RNA polymerase specialized sigma24 family protein